MRLKKGDVKALDFSFLLKTSPVLHRLVEDFEGFLLSPARRPPQPMNNAASAMSLPLSFGPPLAANYSRRNTSSQGFSGKISNTLWSQWLANLGCCTGCCIYPGQVCEKAAGSGPKTASDVMKERGLRSSCPSRARCSGCSRCYDEGGPCERIL